MATSTERYVLRDFPMAARLVLAAFLISVGVGYFSALVQLHFQHATPGAILPEPDDAVRAYSGQVGISQLQRLLETDEGKQFNGSGSMRPAFTTRSGNWNKQISKYARANNLDIRKAEPTLRAERDGERRALLAWIRAGADRKVFEENSFVLPTNLVKHPITSDFVEIGPDGTKRVKIASIVERRCARCHSPNAPVSEYPLDTYEEIYTYCQVETTGGGMSLKKLAQSTHVHLLGFSMLYGMTGLILAFSSYPGWFRALLGPFTLVAQVVDISCWWLAPLHPGFAKAVIFTGAAVAVGLMLQITLSLLNLFGKTGKVILCLLLAATVVLGYVVAGRIVQPYLLQEGLTANVPE